MSLSRNRLREANATVASQGFRTGTKEFAEKACELLREENHQVYVKCEDNWHFCMPTGEFKEKDMSLMSTEIRVPK